MAGFFSRLFSRGTSSDPDPIAPPLDTWDDFDPNLAAYDLILRPGADPDQPDYAGWCFGLPRGITPEQWPLDPNSGYPLQHGFTLILPPKFRVHGPDTAGVAFFSVASDHNDGMPLSTDGLAEIILTPSDSPPEDPDLAAFWHHTRAAHPRLHRMQDILGCQYAVIPLTEDDLSGPPCPVPDIAQNPALSVERPGWLDMGSAAFLIYGYQSHVSDDDLSKQYNARAIGGLPEKRVDYAVPILLRPREGDPNAGKTPTEYSEDTDYEQMFDENLQLKPWAKSLDNCHLGGTAFPVQAMPELTPHYIEFEEYFGGYNFGGGNAQLDLKTFRFDWACG